MHTCYLFVDNFDDENCLSIRLNDDGAVSEDLAVRSIDDFRSLQQDSRTIVVLSAMLTAIHTLEMPLLSENKVRPAIAYALEESLAEQVGDLHFAFDTKHYIDGKYLVVVIEKNMLFELQHKLEKLQIEYNAIISDWFALNAGESCVVSNRYMVNSINFKGALDLDLFNIYLKSQIDFSHILMFNDSPDLPYADKFTKVHLDTYKWLATQLFKQNPINLCQGEFTHNTNSEVAKKYFKIAGILGGAWFVSLLISKILLLTVLNHQLGLYDKKIFEVYHKFFPDAKQVISPKFRINQILQHNQSGYNGIFWQLLAKFTTVVQEVTHDKQGAQKDSVMIKQINMQNGSLVIAISCRDFEILEKIESGLKLRQVKVHKSGALTKGDKVVTTLELT